MRFLPPTLKTWHAAALLACAVATVYGGTLGHGLVGFDDVGLLGARGGEAGVTSLVRQFSESPASAAVRLWTGRPLTHLSQALDQTLFGRDYWGHHAANVFYHLVAALLACVVASRLLGSLAWGLAAALIFALHPLQTESVAYLAGRRDLLCGLLALASFACWTDGRRAAALALWLLSLTAKQTSVTLPLLFLAWEALLAPEGARRTRRGPWLALAALAGLVVALHVHGELATQQAKGLPPGQYWYGGAAWTHWATEPRILVRALGLLLWPATLSADYSWRAFEPARSFFEPAVATSLALLAGLAALGWRLRRREPHVAFALCWLAASYAPMLPLLPTLHNQEPFAEHWLYLPMFGFALLTARLLQRASPHFPRAAPAAAAALLLALGARSASRNRAWRDDLTLWSSAAAAQPRAARAWANLGAAHLNRGRAARAEELFRRAHALRPDEHRFLINLADALLAQGRAKEAEAALLSARALPLARLAQGHIAYGLGRACVRLGRLEEARAWWRSVPRSDEGAWVAAAVDSGRLRAAQGKRLTAENHFRAALEARPDRVDALHGLGVMLLGRGLTAESIPPLEAAVSREPFHLDARLALARAYTATGAFNLAHLQLMRVLALAPRSAAAWSAQSALDLARGLHGPAWSAGQRAVELSATPQAYWQLQQVRRARQTAGALPPRAQSENARARAAIKRQRVPSAEVLTYGDAAVVHRVEARGFERARRLDYWAPRGGDWVLVWSLETPIGERERPPRERARAAPGAAAEEEGERDLSRALERLRRAVRARDWRAASGLLSADMLRVPASGHISGREHFLAALRDAPGVPERAAGEDELLTFGDAALARRTLRRGTGEFRQTDLWVRRHGRGLLAVRQTAAFARPKPAN